MKNNHCAIACILFTLILAACSTAPEVSNAVKPPASMASVTEHHNFDDINELAEYQRQVLQMSSADIVKAIAELNLQAMNPQTQIKKAILYANLHGNGDLLRAQILLDQLLKSTDPESAKYKPVAIFLYANFVERLRLEDTIDKLSVQVRDSQKHLDQLIEKLEALKNIERQLPSRSGANFPSGDLLNKSDGGNK